MATNHFCESYGSNHIIRTKASNIELVSFYKGTHVLVLRVRDSGYYGMNASFFNSGSTRYPAILNIAYQDGENLGCDIDLPSGSVDGYENLTGTSLAYWNGSTVGIAHNVLNGDNSIVPKRVGTWAQGGIGLYLGDSKWASKFDGEGSVYSITDMAYRTGLIVNRNTKDVYLFACPTRKVSVSAFRQAMMDYLEIKDGSSNGGFDAIMLDGGSSAQIYCDSLDEHPLTMRPIPQAITLKNKR